MSFLYNSQQQIMRRVEVISSTNPVIVLAVLIASAISIALAKDRLNKQNASIRG